MIIRKSLTFLLVFVLILTPSMEKSMKLVSKSGMMSINATESNLVTVFIEAKGANINVNNSYTSYELVRVNCSVGDLLNITVPITNTYNDLFFGWIDNLGNRFDNENLIYSVPNASEVHLYAIYSPQQWASEYDPNNKLTTHTIRFRLGSRQVYDLEAPYLFDHLYFSGRWVYLYESHDIFYINVSNALVHVKSWHIEN
ncbi:MAG: hypothetical protein Q6351_010750 [Candidatus Njordarchaeum guaymaensis]